MFPTSYARSWWFPWIPYPRGRWNKFHAIFLRFQDESFLQTTFAFPSAWVNEMIFHLSLQCGLRRSCKDIHHFWCCHLRRRRSLLSEYSIGSWLVFVTSEYNPATVLLKFCMTELHQRSKMNCSLLFLWLFDMLRCMHTFDLRLSDSAPQGSLHRWFCTLQDTGDSMGS